MPALIDVYPYRQNEGTHQFLILRRAQGKQYAGQWRMVGGKCDDSETAWQSGLRELKEETGVFPKLFWSVPSVNQFYDHQNDRIYHIPAFAAQISNRESIQLNEEHTVFKWIERAQVSSFINWPEQQRLIMLIDKILKSQTILDEWKIAL